VSLVIDDYSEDWSRLAYVLVRGLAEAIEPGGRHASEHERAVDLLREKYPQYGGMAVDDRRLIIRIEILGVKSWSSAGTSSIHARLRSGHSCSHREPSMTQRRPGESDKACWLDGNPHQIDSTFQDKVLLPGFVEAHGHPLIGGFVMTEAQEQLIRVLHLAVGFDKLRDRGLPGPDTPMDRTLEVLDVLEGG